MRSIHVSKQERRRLEKVIAQRSAPAGLVRRVRTILMLHEGGRPVDVANALGVSDRAVRRWRSSWEKCRRLESLYELERAGRPPVIGIEIKCEVVKLACSRPEDCGVWYRFAWTQEEIAFTLKRQTGVKISRSSVQRILSAEGLRPHKVRQWLHSPDPDFQEKVARVCDLYLNPPKDAVVLCIDEKPMQALQRRHPTRFDMGEVRYEFEYKRNGTGTLLAAFNVQTGRVFGRVVPERSGAALIAFMEEVAHQYPDKQVYVVWDNLNIHKDGKDLRWTRFNRRHDGRFHFDYTPLHASWVNQVEVWFSILHRRVIRHGSFSSTSILRDRVEGFISYWNLFEAHPFRWRFSGHFEQTPVRNAA